ncbi:MAG TPA: EF-hand domain-containing protein [Candidatus Paceibacterota bacterium]
MAENTKFSLGDYMNEIFDLNHDGKVTFKEFLSVLIPSYAVGIALLVVDLLAAVAEYRVWDVGMTITGGDVYKALGFVLVSALPFYLGQVLWLYPRATGWQQAISVSMVVVALLTSAQFGLADLSQTYDVSKIISLVVWLTFGYICALLVYVLIDKHIRLYRKKIQAQSTASFQKEINAVGRSIMADLRSSLQEEQALRLEFGSDAVDKHLNIFRENKKGGGGGGENHQRPPQLPAPGNQPQQKQYPHWELEPFLKELGLTKFDALQIANGMTHADQFYKALKQHGVEKVDISRKNFNKLYGQLRANGQKTANP